MPVPNIESIKNPNSRVSEAYRILRTNIQYSSFKNDKRIIVVTSSGPSEGKTTTTANLAVTLAQTGKKTIILDCDMRSPRIHKLFWASNESGLSDILVGNTLLQDAIHKTEIGNLYVLPAGTKPPNPSELLETEKMDSLIEALKGDFEYILIDTPPVLIVTDAQILSKKSDGCILVVTSGKTEREPAFRAKEMLEKVNARIIGVVLNKAEGSSGSYREEYGKYYISDVKKHKRRIGRSRQLNNQE